MALLAFPASPAGARTIQVAQDGSGEYPTIGQAIDASISGDTIEVAPGTYHERLYYGGRAITVRSLDGPEATIIDADGVASVVVMDFLEGPNSVLDGFTLQDGLGTPVRGGLASGARAALAALSPESRVRERADQAGDARGGRSRLGGGILLLAASPTLRNLIIRDNRSEIGGGLYALQTAPTLERCRFYKNSAGIGPGACCELTDGAIFRDCEFTANLGVAGGGIYLVQGTAVIERCRFERNQGSAGGALHLFDCPSTTWVRESVFYRNQGFDASVALALGSALSLESCTAAANGFPGEAPPAVAFLNGSRGTLHRVILAAGAGETPLALDDSEVEVTCCDLWPNLGPGDSPSGPNLSLWPEFCDVEAGDLRLRDNSPCLPENAPPGCGLIGALPLGCSGTSHGPADRE